MTTSFGNKTGSIPDDWEITDLSSVVDINPESRDPSLKPQEKFSYVDIDSVENGTGVIQGVKKLEGIDAPSRARRVVRTDDVIMSEVRPYLKAFAIIPKKLDNQICSTGFAVLRNKGTIDPKYLLNVLFSNDVIEQCNRMMVGAQYPALNDSQVKKILIPLPPLPEQRRIATILTTIDNAIQRSRQAVAETERLKAGLKQELMTNGIGHTEFREDPDVGAIPTDWQVIEIRQYLDFLTGYAFKSELFIEDASGIKLVRGDNITIGCLRWGDKTRYWKEVTPDLKKYLLEENDVLISMDGSLVGKNYAMVQKKDLPLLLVQRVARLRAFGDLCQDYLYHSISSRNFGNYIDSVKTISAIPHISPNDIKNYKIALPTPSEQKRISTILFALDHKLTLQRQRTAHYEKLKQGLMNELLTGKRRVAVT